MEHLYLAVSQHFNQKLFSTIFRNRRKKTKQHQLRIPRFLLHYLNCVGQNVSLTGTVVVQGIAATSGGWGALKTGAFCGAVCTGAGVTEVAAAGCTIGVMTKLGRADGGCTLDSKLPPALGTLARETPGDGSSEVEDDILLRDSKIFECVFTVAARMLEGYLLCQRPVTAPLSFCLWFRKFRRLNRLACLCFYLGCTWTGIFVFVAESLGIYALLCWL